MSEQLWRRCDGTRAGDIWCDELACWLAPVAAGALLIERPGAALNRMHRYADENCYPAKGPLLPWLDGMLKAACGEGT